MTWQEVPGFPGLVVRLAPNTQGRMVVAGLRLEAEAVTAEMLRKVPLARIENEANAGRHHDDGLPPLRRAPGMSAEAFSRLVASHYQAAAQKWPNPVRVLAGRWGAKDATVHTWVRESRLRGFLPPARRRKGL